MPLTRLANAVIDACRESAEPVADEIEKYLGSDLLCYRAEAPLQAGGATVAAWDPVLAWAREAIRCALRTGARRRACARSRAKPSRPCAQPYPDDPWRLAAVSSMTALTGSALLALALAAGALDVEAAWAAAHVDEDWQMSQWGRDEIALPRIVALREAEIHAAVTAARD